MSFSEYDQYELERYRQEERDRNDQWIREREERRREAKRQAEEAMSYAETWPEAIQKNLVKFGREAAEEASWNAQLANEDEETKKSLGGPQHYFTQSLEATKLAQEVWPEVQAKYDSQIKTLRDQIAELEAKVPLEVAAKIRKQLPDSDGAKGVASSLENESPADFVYW